MRPIDADAWKECVENEFCNPCKDVGLKDCLGCCIPQIINLIQDTRRKKGANLKQEWPSLFECSECHWEDYDTYTGDTDTYNFCPNCGIPIGGGE